MRAILFDILIQISWDLNDGRIYQGLMMLTLGLAAYFGSILLLRIEGEGSRLAMIYMACCFAGCTIKDTVPIFSYTTDFFPAGFPSALVWEDRRIIKDKKVFVYIDNEEVRPGQDRIKGFVDRLIDTLVFKSDGEL